MASTSIYYVKTENGWIKKIKEWREDVSKFSKRLKTHNSKKIK